MATNLVVGSARAIFTISLTAPAVEPVRVDWETQDGTALAGRDYAASKGTIVFAQGESQRTVEVFVHGRTVDTEDRMFYVHLTPPVNAILADDVGACVIHVDTTGTTPVLTVIIPKGEKGAQGDSAYQVALNNGFVGTEAEWLASLEPDPAEIAVLVAPLINAGPMSVTAEGTEALSHPDTDTVAGFAGRIPFTPMAKKAVAPALTPGVNLIPFTAFVGDALNPAEFPGFNVVAIRGSEIVRLAWRYLRASNEIRVEDGVAGDTPVAVQVGIGGRDASAAMVTAAAEYARLDDLLTYQQAGAGALARTLNNKVLDFVTGGDFSTAQQAANASLGKIFFVPDGANVTIDVPAQSPSLRDAIDAIDQWSIPTTSTVTINIADGHRFTNQATVITHPNAERLTINGPVMSVNCTVTGLVGTSGSRGNYIATLSVSSVAGLAVGDWLYVRDMAGSAGPYKVFNGCYQITAVGVGTVSVRIRLWSATFPAMTLTGGNVYKFRAVIQSLGVDGLIIKSSSPTINYLLFAGNMWDYWSEANIFGTEKGTHGVYIGSNTIVDGAGTPGGENPYGISGGSLSGKFIGAVDFDQQGFTTAGGAGLFGQYYVSSSCGRRGFYVGTGSAMEVKFSVSSTQYRDAVIADYGGAFNTSYFEGNGCRGAGGFANNGGKLIAPNSHFWFNAAGMDIRAGSGGFFDAGSARYNVGDGAHYEYGAGGSISGAELSNNGVDGLSGFYSAAVRTTGAIIKDNGRDNMNLLSSAIGHSGATLSNPGRRNITADGFSSAFDGTNFEPIGNHPACFEVLMTDATKVHTAKLALNSIGDLLITIDGVGKVVIKADGTIHPSVDGGPPSGRSLNRWSAVYTRELIIGTGSVKDFTGTGSPEGNKSAVVGSTYRREDGGAGTCFYVKESGVGNTGWVAK